MIMHSAVYNLIKAHLIGRESELDYGICISDQRKDTIEV